MSRQAFFQAITYSDEEDGILKLANGAEVTVFKAGTEELAKLFQERVGGAEVTNPFILGATSMADFWADTADYDIEVHDTKGPARFGDFVFGWQSSPPLADPNDSVYRTLLTASGLFYQQANTGFTFLLGSVNGVAAQMPYAVTNGSGELSMDLTVAPTSPRIPPEILDFDNDDYLVTGKTQKMKLRANAFINNKAPASNLEFALYPLEVMGNAGATEKMGFKIGAAVASSGVAINAPAANAIVRAASADFAIPSDGLFLLGLRLSAKIPVESVFYARAQLQLHNV